MIETPSARLRAGPLTARAIARFHLPLVLNAWLMALAGPVLNLALARSAEPRLQLAAFWLAFSVLLLAQSACLVMPQASAAALRRRMGLAGIARASALLGVIASALVLAVGGTPFGEWFFRDVLPAAPRTAALARAALVVLSPVPLLVVLRGVAGGVATVERRTEAITAATAVRVVVLIAIGVATVSGRTGMTAVVAAWALLLGAAAEALVMIVFMRGPSRLHAASHTCERVSPVLAIVLPLAVASLVWTAVRPLIGAILGRLAYPELAQAGFGVVLPLLMMSCAPLWGFLEVTLVLPKDAGDVARLLRFALFTSIVFSATIGLIAGSPLREIVLRSWFALSPELERAVVPALGLLALEPLVLSARAIAQGLLLRSGHTTVLLALSPIKLAVIALAGYAAVRFAPGANGAVLALALVLGGDVVDLILYGAAVLRLDAWRISNGNRAPSTAGNEILQEAA